MIQHYGIEARADAGLALSVLGAAVMIAAAVNEWVWHVTEIRVISVFPVHIIVKQEWWE